MLKETERTKLKDWEQVGVNDNLNYHDLNDPRVEYHACPTVRWSVGQFHRSSLRKPNLANFQSRRTFGSTWETSESLSVLQESSSFVPHRGTSYFRLILEDCPWKPFQWKIYFSPSSFIVFPLRLFATLRCGSSRRKVEKEIRLHVSRINFSLALDVLLFSIRCVFELTSMCSAS